MTDQAIWGVELKAERQGTLLVWQSILTPSPSPSDPFVEIHDVVAGHGEESLFVLRSAEFDGQAVESIFGKADILIQQLNSAVPMILGSGSGVSAGAVIELLPGRKPVRHYRQEEARIRWGEPGIAYPELRDREGNVVLHRSPAQKWLEAARENDAFEVALTHVTGAPTWIDLHNAYEALEKNGLAQGVWSKNERDRFTQTANAYHRHYKGRFAPPRKPMTTKEGREFVRKMLDAAVREILAV